MLAFLLLLILPDRQKDQIKAHEIHLGKRLVVRLSLAIALSTIQMTVRFGSAPWQWSGTSSPSANLTRGLATSRLFRALPCRYGTIHFHTFMPFPGFQLKPSGIAAAFSATDGRVGVREKDLVDDQPEMETFEVELVKDQQGLGITIAGYVCEKGGSGEELLRRIDRQNSRFRTAKTIMIKLGLQASFVELESTKNALNECHDRRVIALGTHIDVSSRGSIIGHLECGFTQMEISEKLGVCLEVTQNVTSRLWQRFQDYEISVDVTVQFTLKLTQSVTSRLWQRFQDNEISVDVTVQFALKLTQSVTSRL
ncbi:uncharacterized protein TNCV_1571371 [Trichonephila clavipes]|uniref:Uncharacterized protein n=1 Tax=Trichonephila clavipes TaxID=2585209 RepID=A0A8X6SKX5_TRICX|nr:uncharacterized protein TNCV_1571371 [Trichonephila clavipes]